MNSISRSRLSDAGLAGQLIAATGALLALLSPFGVGFAGAGVACLILGVVISAPYARDPGPYLAEWWTTLAVAAFTCLAGFGLGYVLVPLGGVLTAVGAVAALIAVALGAPPSEAGRED